MSDIERIPSMRKTARQGVPKRKPHDMAMPMAESGKTKDAPSIAPRVGGAPEEPTIPMDPTLALELELAAEPVFEGVSPPVPVVEPEPEPNVEPETWIASAQSADLASPEEPPAPPEPPQVTLRGLLETVDAAFAEFSAAAHGYPAEHMTDRLGADAWTRKQMLEHVATWHDLTTDRLTRMTLSGQSVPLDRDIDAVNSGAARVALGKSVGEVLQDINSSFGRLHRQMTRLTEEQLHLDDDWAPRIIASNTYEHYADHIAELTPPEPPVGSGTRR